MMDIETYLQTDATLKALRTSDPAYRDAELLARSLGATTVRIKRWQRRRGATVHIVFDGGTASVTYKRTVAVCRKRRSDHG